MTTGKVGRILRRWRLALAVVGVTAVAGAGGALAVSSDPATSLVFHLVAPTRVLDTRLGTGAPIGPLGPNATLDVAIPGVPDDAAAIAVNVTSDRGSGPSFLTLYATGDPRPNTSTLNWMSSSPVANGATVIIHADHSLRVFNAANTVDVIIDLVGYYAPGTGATGQSGPPGPPGPAGPPGPPGKDAEAVVSTLTDPWTATNASVSLTADGVEFGPYADGGAAGGSVLYTGMNGQPLSAVKGLAYYMRYVATGDSGGVGVPYLRIFTDLPAGQLGAHDAIFSPNTQSPDADVAEGPFHEWVATSGSWRWDDDAGNGPDMSFDALITAHGDAPITGIYISTGFSAGTDLAALLRWVEINGQRFVFRG